MKRTLPTLLLTLLASAACGELDPGSYDAYDEANASAEEADLSDSAFLAWSVIWTSARSTRTR